MGADKPPNYSFFVDCDLLCGNVSIIILLKGDIIMPQKNSVTFEFPDGNHAELITWDYVLDMLNTSMLPILEKMYQSNTHLENIAKKLEELVDEED